MFWYVGLKVYVLLIVYLFVKVSLEGVFYVGYVLE